MNAYVSRHYAATTLWRIGAFLHHAATTLRNGAQRLDSLVAARRKAADDRRILNEMTERELLDIGVSGAEVEALRSGERLHARERFQAIAWRQPM